MSNDLPQQGQDTSEKVKLQPYFEILPRVL